MEGVYMEHRVTVFSQSLIPGNIGNCKKLTTRLVVPVNVNGTALQVRFSNRPARKESRLDEIAVALCNEQGIIEESTGRSVTFRGSNGLVLAAGAEAVSDRIELPVRAGQYLALSLYGARQPHSINSLGRHGIRSRKGNYCTANFVPDTGGYLITKLLKTPMDTIIPLFRGLDVFTEETPAVISCFGDSITQQCHWYSNLLDRLYRVYPGGAVLLNAGIAGNRLLNDSPQGFGGLFGKAGVNRVEWDSLADHGVTHILFALGINDAGQTVFPWDKTPPPSADEFARGCRILADKAHARNIKVIALTIYPGNMDKDPANPVKENARLAYNEVIRNGVFDDYLDIEAALKKPDGVGYKDGYAQADGLHLSETGGKALADSIDLARLIR
jgi:lysophospholipase L1-like esterase